MKSSPKASSQKEDVKALKPIYLNRNFEKPDGGPKNQFYTLQEPLYVPLFNIQTCRLEQTYTVESHKSELLLVKVAKSSWNNVSQFR